MKTSRQLNVFTCVQCSVSQYLHVDSKQKAPGPEHLLCLQDLLSPSTAASDFVFSFFWGGLLWSHHIPCYCLIVYPSLAAA